MTFKWPLLRLYAFSIEPGIVIQGGSVPTSRAIGQALLEAHERAKLDNGLPVSFVVDTATRTCEMREHLIAVAFSWKISKGEHRSKSHLQSIGHCNG